MKLLLWFGMLSKRLYKKPTFLAILLLIPLLVLGYTAAADGDSGMITVALAQEGQDQLAREVMEGFDGSSQLIRYTLCHSPEEAKALVQGGKADMAWLFPDEMQAKLAAFLQQPTEKNALVTVLVREDDVSLRLAREKLSGMLFSQLSRLLYLSFVRQNVPELSHLSDGELMDYYRTQDITEDLFAFDEANASMVSVQTVHYLTAPVRGLLAVVILLCGMATAMYYIQDSALGVFGWVSTRRLPAVELGCQLVSLVNVSAAVLLTLILAGQSSSFLRELSVTALYCLCCAGFCMLLRRLCGNLRIMGVLLPLLVVVMLLVCPVFFDLAMFRSLQYLFPPTYYVNAIYNIKYLLFMVLHTAGSFSLYVLCGLLRRER